MIWGYHYFWKHPYREVFQIKHDFGVNYDFQIVAQIVLLEEIPENPGLTLANYTRYLLLIRCFFD